MAEKSAISWTRSTFNPWIGCTKVGPGCDHCYAAVSTPARSLGVVWGPGQPRKRTTPHNWNGPLKWNKRAGEEKASGIITSGWESWGKPGFWPVFCASLADVFDNEVPQEWRNDLWDLIDATPNLSWLLVTKRIGNVRSMIPDRWSVAIPDHVRILITVTNQEEADRDIPKLLQLKCKNGISYEPALGPVDWRGWHFFRDRPMPGGAYPSRLEWIIVGGESSQGGMDARPFDIEWARSTIKQCRDAGVPVFVKQLGSSPYDSAVETVGGDGPISDPPTQKELEDIADTVLAMQAVREKITDRAGANPSEWPEDLRVQEFPA